MEELYDSLQKQSWVKLAEQAEQTIKTLTDHVSLIVVDNVDEIASKNIVIFDTSYTPGESSVAE